MAYRAEAKLTDSAVRTIYSQGPVYKDNKWNGWRTINHVEEEGD